MLDPVRSVLIAVDTLVGVAVPNEVVTQVWFVTRIAEKANAPDAFSLCRPRLTINGGARPSDWCPWAGAGPGIP